jgi:D-3-phosphoglycerate dehydrogenase
MNTPFGNSITTAEHAIAMMFASPARSRPPTLDPGRQVGEEPLHGRRAHGKTLGVIGCGNIGSIVADRAIGLKMKVIAFDPFLSPERALELGVEKVELDELLARADFITLHTPLTDKTRNILDAERWPRPRRACASSTARAAAWSTKALRGARQRPCRRRGASTCSPSSRPTENPLFGRAQRRLHAASRRLDLRGAGERGAAGRRADGGLPADGRRLQRAQHALDHGRGSAEAGAVRRARRKARLVRGPAHRDRHQAADSLPFIVAISSALVFRSMARLFISAGSATRS